jgi:hypothetical protein
MKRRQGTLDGKINDHVALVPRVAVSRAYGLKMSIEKIDLRFSMRYGAWNRFSY